MENRKLETDILILGKGGVSLSAIRTIRAGEKEVRIAVVSKENGPFYSPVLLPYYLSGEIPRKTLFALGADFFERNSADTYFGRKLEIVRAKNKKVLLDDGAQISYEKLIIGTGASPSIPPIKGIKNKGVFSLRTLEDADLLLGHLRKRAVILGAGAAAIGIAIALHKRGIEVAVVYRRGLSSIIGGRVDIELAREVLRNLEQNGVQVFFNQYPIEMEVYGDPVRAVRGRDLELSCDTVVVATGGNPNADFINPEEIQIGIGGRIIVDDRMMTSDENVYAAGDCAEAINFVTGKMGNSPIWPNAIEQGKVAALNALGVECRYKGFINRNVINLFGKSLFIAGEISGDKRRYDEEGKRCCVTVKGKTVIGCQILGVSEDFGVYLGMIKKKHMIDKMIIPVTAKRKTCNASRNICNKIFSNDVCET